MEENKNLKPKQTEAKASKKQDAVMPPIKQLLEESWHLFTKKVLKLLLISTYTFVGVVGIYIIAALIAAALFFGFATGAASIQIAAVSMISNPVVWVSAGVLFVLFVVAMSIISLMAQAGFVLALAEKDETASAFTLLKRGWVFVLPLFVVGLIEFVITFGSIFLLIIPAILIGIFLAFTLYTVVLENKKGMDAIKMSAGIVQQNFGAIVGRFVLYFLLIMAVMIALAALSSISEEVAALSGLVRFVINFFINWFSLAFTFQIYQHARAAYDEKKPASVTWMWIVSAIGWVIAGLLITVAVQAIGNVDLEKLIQQMDDTQKRELDIERNREYMPEMPSSDSEEFYKMFDEQTQKELKQLQEMGDGNQI